MRSRGFTLIEVLVSCSILGVLSSALLYIWLACRPVMEKTEGKIDVQARVREPLRRVSRLLDTAISPGSGGPIKTPAEGAPASAVLEFYSCDTLAGPETTVDPRNPVFYLYRIQQVSGELRLEKLDASGTTVTDTANLGKGVEMRFKLLSGGAVGVEATAGQGPESLTLSTTLALPRGN